MASQSERIGKQAVEMMEQIERSFGEDVTVGAVGIVCDLVASDKDGMGSYHVITACSDPRAWVQSKLFEEAAAECEHENQVRIAEVHEED